MSDAMLVRHVWPVDADVLQRFGAGAMMDMHMFEYSVIRGPSTTITEATQPIAMWGCDRQNRGNSPLTTV